MRWLQILGFLSARSFTKSKQAPPAERVEIENVEHVTSKRAVNNAGGIFGKVGPVLFRSELRLRAHSMTYNLGN